VAGEELGGVVVALAPGGGGEGEERNDHGEGERTDEGTEV
jgi:hypothetical protein